jgi:NAD(P)-dependent dehydrogenase (short-subunit alcohol dehydrogenase family)
MTNAALGLKSARILVTGGSSGIGFKVAQDLASAGSLVWIAGRTDRVISAASKLGPNAIGSQVDVTSPQSVGSLFSEIREIWGGLDIVIHAAGELGQAGRFWELGTEEFVHTLRINTGGAFFVARAFVQSWLANKGAQNYLQRGKVVLFAGGGAGYGYPKFLPYGTSKAAAVRMCETMAMELDEAQVPIDVNIIAPGANETAMLAAVRAAGGEVRTTVPFSKPVALCRWLASSASDGISGRFIHVNDPYEGASAAVIREDALKLRRIDL